MAEKKYIERGALLTDEMTHTLPCSCGRSAGRVVVFVDEIEALPAADVVEVRHGEWKADTDEYEICATEFTCSCCKESFASSEMTDEDFLQMMKYCPNCGAKMDGERKEQK